MNGKVKQCFAGGNTAAGLYSLYDSAFQGVKTLFVLQGYPGTGKSSMIQRIAGEMAERGCHLQLFYNPLDSDTLDGVIVTDLRIGIVDSQTWAASIASEDAEVIEVNLKEAVDSVKRAEASEAIAALEAEIKQAYESAYATFLRTLHIHDEWEKFYIENLDVEKANRVADDLADTLFKDAVGSRQPVVRHLFLGAATARGAVDFIPNLTEDMDRRIFVKGRPGSGKSTIFKKLASAAEEKGISAEVFHCGFDPNSLDMLIFPELRVAIFDSTAPHEHFPSREGDEILDMYELAIAPGTDEKYAEAIEEIRQRYAGSMKEAISYLSKVKTLRDELKSFYSAATDFAVVERAYQELQAKLGTLV